MFKGKVLDFGGGISPPGCRKPSSPLGWLWPNQESWSKSVICHDGILGGVGRFKFFKQLGEVRFCFGTSTNLFWFSKTWNKWVNSFRKMLVIYQLKLSLVPQPTLKNGVCSVLSELLNICFFHIGTKTLTKLFTLETAPHPRCSCSVCRGMKKYVLIFDTFDVLFSTMFQ